MEALNFKSCIANISGLPLSVDSIAASSSLLFSSASANLWMSFARWDGLTLDHSFTASWDALTARSTSAFPADATLAIIFPVDGSMVSNVLPSLAACHLPPMSKSVFRLMDSLIPGMVVESSLFYV
jgi:hypothetical protein